MSLKYLGEYLSNSFKNQCYAIRIVSKWLPFERRKLEFNDVSAATSSVSTATRGKGPMFFNDFFFFFNIFIYSLHLQFWAGLTLVVMTRSPQKGSKILKSEKISN